MAILKKREGRTTGHTQYCGVGQLAIHNIANKKSSRILCWLTLGYNIAIELEYNIAQNLFTYIHLEIISLDHQSYIATNTVQELCYGYSSSGQLHAATLQSCDK